MMIEVKRRKTTSSQNQKLRPAPSNVGPLSESSDKPLRLTVPLVAAVLLAVIVIAYLPAMRGDFIWDDDDYVSNNQTLRSAQGLRSIWFDPSATPQYYPLVHTSFWLEY